MRLSLSSRRTLAGFSPLFYFNLSLYISRAVQAASGEVRRGRTVREALVVCGDRVHWGAVRFCLRLKDGVQCLSTAGTQA